MAGPNAITPQQLDKMCTLIEVGMSKYRAARLAGVSERNLTNYLQKGKEEDSHEGYREIWTRVNAAEAEALGQLEKTWYEQAKLDWKAAERFLRARLPEEYGDRKAVEISGPGGGPVQSETREMSWEEHARRLRGDVLGVQPAPTFGLNGEGWSHEPEPDDD